MLMKGLVSFITICGSHGTSLINECLSGMFGIFPYICLCPYLIMLLTLYKIKGE